MTRASRLTHEQVAEVRRRRAEGERVTALSREYYIDKRTIHKLMANPDWMPILSRTPGEKRAAESAYKKSKYVPCPSCGEPKTPKAEMCLTCSIVKWKREPQNAEHLKNKPARIVQQKGTKRVGPIASTLRCSQCGDPISEGAQWCRNCFRRRQAAERQEAKLAKERLRLQRGGACPGEGDPPGAHHWLIDDEGKGVCLKCGIVKRYARYWDDLPPWQRKAMTVSVA